MTQSESKAPAYKTGDSISIMRGIHRGKTATVLDVDTANEQYAVKLTDGGLVVVNFVNVREPQEVSITATALGAVLDAYPDLPEAFLADLEKAAPGITA
jgi:ribosomal protein L24